MAVPASRTDQPDVVLIMVDQLAQRWLEVARTGVVPTPNLDALARSGAEFTRAFSTNPVCSPSRATIATGLTSQGHGVTECGYDLDPSVPTFMQVLQNAGWRTGAFGKFHFTTQIDGVVPDIRPYGFDVAHVTEDARAGEWTEWVREHRPEHYEAVLSTVWMTMIPELRSYGPEHTDLVAQIEAARRKYPETAEPSYVLPFPAEVSQSAWITDRACDFIRSVGAGERLFAQVSYVQPHNPFTPPPGYLDRVAADAIPEPLPAEWNEDPRLPYFDQDLYTRPSYDSTDWLRDRRHYFADLAHLDEEIGRLLACLDEAGRRENSLIVFTSDHGELLHDHGMTGKWERHYDACIRIPLIVSGPGVESGLRTDLVDHTDIAPTIYSATGLTHPPLNRPDLGRPRVPTEIEPLPGRALQNTATAPRTSVYVQSNNNHWNASPQSWARTLRSDEWRYTLFLGDGGEQLFDLRSDPEEQVNLATSTEHRETLQSLRFHLLTTVAGEGYPNSPRSLAGIGTW